MAKFSKHSLGLGTIWSVCHSNDSPGLTDEETIPEGSNTPVIAEPSIGLPAQGPCSCL